MANNDELKSRDIYLNKLIAFQDKEPVKVVTGIRRSGKSKLLSLMMKHLLEEGKEKEQIIEMNFERMDFSLMSYKDVYDYVKERIIEGKRMYLFLDEIQRIDGWENAVNALRVEFDVDIYVTGSNAYLLSSEYSTYLAGRCVEIKMLPLSFREFLDFHDFEVRQEKDAFGKEKRAVIGKNGEKYTTNEAFSSYLLYGGMPGIKDVGLDQEKAFMLLEGIYSTVIARDILERGERRGKTGANDAVLLRKLTMFLSDNIGSNVSFSSIGGTLKNEGLPKTKGKGAGISPHTVETYVRSLLDAYMFYEVKRFDIKGKEYLKTLGKYYIVDIGLRNYLLGIRDRDRGHVLENIVYFELLRRGYDVAIGKLGDKEIDFIATKVNEKVYIQVTESLENESTRTRELDPLTKIDDNYEKLILSMDEGGQTYDGIKAKNVVDWLLG